MRLLLFIICTHAFERLWIIRHCDKPDGNNPCCSQTGYQRALFWSQYLSDKITNSSTVYFISSGSSSHKKCSSNRTIDTRCQKSERLALTSSIIRKNLYLPSLISKDFCVGDTNKLLKAINQSTQTDVILVWEHNEILEIIHKLGWRLKKWPKEDEYNIIFLIENNHLYYDITNMREITELKEYSLMAPVKDRRYLLFIPVLIFIGMKWSQSRSQYTRIL